MCINCNNQDGCIIGQRTLPIEAIPPIVPIVPDPTICAACCEESDDTVEHDGNDYCRVCFHDNFFICNDCEETTDNDDMHSPERGEGCFCESCYNERYSRCDSCNCELSNVSDEVYDSPTGSYCCDCYDDRYNVCDGCGNIYHIDDLSYNDGCHYCCDCREEDDECDGPSVKGMAFHPSNNSAERTGGSYRTYGVELETHRCPGYTEFTADTYFDAKDDGSICGKEFVSKVLSGDKGLEAVSAFCRHAERNDFEINRDCGFHIHIGVGDLTDLQRKTVCEAYKAFEALWQSFVPDIRRNNNYCKAIRWQSGDVPCSGFYSFAGTQDRYQWFNVSAFTEHGTFEIRLHTPTLSATKVNNWTRAHLAFVEFMSKRALRTIRARFVDRSLGEQFDVLCEIFRAAGMDDLCEFYWKRARKFGLSLILSQIPESEETEVECEAFAGV
jgi:hypothetical protein